MRRLLIIFGITAPIWSSHSASPASYNWKGIAPISTWNSASNWSPGSDSPASPIPTSADYAEFDTLSSTPQVSVDLGTYATAKIVYFNSQSTTYTLGTGMTGSQAFTFDNGGQFAVKATNSVGHSINADIEFGTAAVTSTLNFVNFSFESSLLVTGDIHSESAGRVVFFGISSDLSGTRISGSISGPLSLEVSSGRAILSGHNTYTGETFVAGGKLTLGASNVLSDISPVVLSVGTLATGGFSDTVGTLQLSYDSTIDFGTGSSALTFADSSAIPWTGTLSLTNFDIGTDVLKFGSTSTALTPAQLSQISLPGYQAGLESDGTVSFVAVPEPSTNLLCALAGFLGIVGTATSRIGSRAGI